MAYDKLCDSAVLDAGLKAIADAIREKGGTSDNLAFPTAMAEAIAAIEVGGGYDFAGTAYEIVSGSFALATDTIVNAHMPSSAPLNLGFTKLDGLYEKQNRYFVMWANIPNEHRLGTNLSSAYYRAANNTLLGIFLVTYNNSGKNKHGAAYIYSTGSGMSSGNGFYFGAYNTVYTTDTTRFFAAGVEYNWVAWSDKTLADY